MTWIDAAIVVVMLFFVVTAFQGGLVREIIAFASTLAGIVIAGMFYDDLRDSMFTSIDNDLPVRHRCCVITSQGIMPLSQ